jgi:hypothetical protein
LVGGRVDVMFASSTTSMPLIRDGKLRALVTTLPRRSHLLPGRADDRRGRVPQLQHHLLGGAVRAGEDARRRRRAA